MVSTCSNSALHEKIPSSLSYTSIVYTNIHVDIGYRISKITAHITITFKRLSCLFTLQRHIHIIHITVDLYTFVLSNNLHSDKQENKSSSGTLLGSSVIPETQQGLDLWSQDNTTGAMSKLNPLPHSTLEFLNCLQDLCNHTVTYMKNSFNYSC